MLGKGYIKKAWDIYMDDLGNFLLAYIILSIINAVAFSLLTGPVMCGMMYMTLKKLRGEKVDLSDAFRGFDNFGYTFVAGIVYVVVLGVGALFLIIPAFILGALFIYMFPFLIDKKMRFEEAFRASVDLVKGNLLEHTLFFFVVSLISISGLILCGIGVLFTLPLFYLAFAVAYYKLVYPAEKEGEKQIKA
jgi:uncharacterized membrane protein